MADQDDLSLSRFAKNPIVDEDESDVEEGPLESVEVTLTPPPPPPPAPKFNLEEHAAQTPAQEQAVVIERTRTKRGTPEYKARMSESNKRSAATVRAARLADPELAELDRQKEEFKEIKGALDEEGGIDNFDVESDKDLANWLKSTRLERYKEMFKLAKKSKSEAIKLKALTILEHRDLGRPGAAPAPDSEDEPGGILL